MKLILLMTLLLAGCIDDGKARDQMEYEAAQKSCLDSCTRGIEKLEVGSYGGFKCECRQ